MRSELMNKAFQILLISLILFLSVSSVFAGGRAGRFQLQPFFGPASTNAHLWSGNQEFAILYGAQADLFIIENIAVGISYTYANYGEYERFIDLGREDNLFKFAGPVMNIAHFRLKYIPFDAGPITPYLKVSTGYLKIDQDGYRITSIPESEIIGTIFGEGISYSIGAGGYLEFAQDLGVFFEASRMWSDVFKNQSQNRDTYSEEFWTLKTGLSFWY